MQSMRVGTYNFYETHFFILSFLLFEKILPHILHWVCTPQMMGGYFLLGLSNP
jgi:hypothetical protein